MNRPAPALASPGHWPLWTCQFDPRFSYSVYLPVTPSDIPRPLMVMVHGSGRVAETYRNLLADTAEALNAVLLCPLFPCGAASPEDTESYKFVYWPGLRYDLVLLAMIEELAAKVSMVTDQFFLAGYSGGGQFAHRFFYGHPERLCGVSVGAPGTVTLLDTEKPWWVGINGLEAYLGFVPDIVAMREVKVQLVVGGDDNQPMVSAPPSQHFMPGINAAGTNRLEKISTLHNSLRGQGINCQLVTVPGIAHDGFALLDPVRQFADQCLGR